MPHWCCRTWCGHSRAVTPCLSSCCYHYIVISMQISLSPSNSGTVGVSSLRRRVHFSHTADHCYSLVVIQNIPDEPPKCASSCGVQASSSGWCVEGISGLKKLSRGFLRLVAPLPTLPPPGPLCSGLPQSSPSSSTNYSFPYYKSVLPQRFGSTVGAAISLFLPVGVYPMVSSSVSMSIFSLCLSLY